MTFEETLRRYPTLFTSKTISDFDTTLMYLKEKLSCLSLITKILIIIYFLFK